MKLQEKCAAHEAIQSLRQVVTTSPVPTVKERRRVLRALLDSVRGNRDRIFAALKADLGKSFEEAAMTEYLPLLDALKLMIRKLPRWAAPKRCGVSVYNFPATGRIVPEPYGLVLVIATWNYPLLLALEPLAAALAAGNRAVLYCSDKSTATGAVVAEIVRGIGGAVIGSEMTFDEVLSERWDMIFFTGGESGGREVLRHAAEHLTPAVLELGGKSPCIVCAKADIEVTARRIVWGKFTNAGQTCVAPDYLWVERSVKAPLLAAIRRAVREFYGDSALENPDYPRIVNEAHFRRLTGLLEGRVPYLGGDHDLESCRIAPTVLDHVNWDDPIMEREIFGPILPVLEFESLAEVPELLRTKPKPLALYAFGATRAERQLLEEGCSSGAICFDDTVMHFVNNTMPFGGVGASGMGSYHGIYGFNAFSHFKPVMRQAVGIDWPVRYPPFGKWKKRLMEYMVHNS